MEDFPIVLYLQIARLLIFRSLNIAFVQIITFQIFKNSGVLHFLEFHIFACAHGCSQKLNMEYKIAQLMMICLSICYRKLIRRVLTPSSTKIANSGLELFNGKLKISWKGFEVFCEDEGGGL